MRGFYDFGPFFLSAEACKSKGMVTVIVASLFNDKIYNFSAFFEEKLALVLIEIS